MTIGNELDQAFYNLGQRITRLEKKEVEYSSNESADKETVLGIEADLTSQIEQLQERIDGLDFDDLESALEEVRDNVSYNDDRIDEMEAYKCDEGEVECIVERMLDDALCDAVTDVVREEIDKRTVDYSEWAMLADRVKELEDRLNKPSLGARALRWLREGPSIKEVATNWYAGIRRGS